MAEDAIVNAVVTRSPQVQGLLEDFARSSFEACGGEIPNGKISLESLRRCRQEMLDAIEDFFVKKVGLKLPRIDDRDFEVILLEKDLDEDEYMTWPEHQEFCRELIKKVGSKALIEYAKRYGIGIAVGFTGVSILKRTAQFIPQIGPVARVVMSLVPPIIVGPLVGIAGVYVHDGGDLKVPLGNLRKWLKKRL